MGYLSIDEQNKGTVIIHAEKTLEIKIDGKTYLMKTVSTGNDLQFSFVLQEGIAGSFTPDAYKQ